MIVVVYPGNNVSSCEVSHMDYKDLEKRVSKLKVMDIQGQEVEMVSLWTDRLIVLTFLRHFG